MSISRDDKQAVGICEICDRPASRTHFGSLTCGGCRAFHKRASKRKTPFRCVSENCTTLNTSKARCKACRFRKYEELISVRTEDDQSPTESVVKNEASPSPLGSASARPRVRKQEQGPPVVHPLDFIDLQTRRTVATVSTVGAVVQTVWGDDHNSWALNKRLSQNHGQITVASYDDLVAAYNHHVMDSVVRGLNFATKLPGASSLGSSTVKACVDSGWKKLVYWTVHHAPYMTERDTYTTIGPNQLHYGRLFHESLLHPDVVDFIYGFAAQFRDIGLTEIEGYLLMIIVMFELGVLGTGSEDQLAEVKEIHGHYSGVLLDVLKQRCSDAAELISICRKLELFFSSFQFADHVHNRFSGNYLMSAEEDGCTDFLDDNLIMAPQWE